MKNLILALACLACSTVHAANELNLSVSFQYSKNGVAIQNQQSGSITVSGTPVASAVTSVGTLDTAVSLGSVTNAGIALLVNATTNSWSVISYGTASNSYPFKLNAGEWSLVRFNTNALHAASSTNAPDLYTIILSQ